MEPQNQPAPAAAPAPTTPPAPPAPSVPPAAPQAAIPQSKTPVWVWFLGGCLGLVLLTTIAIGGFAWWGARKIKQEFKNAQPKLEEWQKNAEKMSNEAEEWQKDAEKWQKEMEKLQDEMPEIPSDYNTSLE